MVFKVADLFVSRSALRRSGRGVRRRRPVSRPVSLESLEKRQLLAAVDDGWIKIDLSNLDQTGLTPAKDIYVQGYATGSGQILQYDSNLEVPGGGTGGLVFTTPLPMDTTFTPSEYTPVIGDTKSITFTARPRVFVGGSVKFVNGSQTINSTIKSISADVTLGAWNTNTNQWDPLTPPPPPSGGSNATIQTAGSMPSGEINAANLTNANPSVVSTAGLSIGSLVVGTANPGASQTYFFPSTNGSPFPASGGPASVTAISNSTATPGTIDATFSESSGLSNQQLGGAAGDFLTAFSGGTSSGFAKYLSHTASTTTVPAKDGGGAVQVVTVGNLLSTGQVMQVNRSVTPPAPQSILIIDGVSGNFPVYGRSADDKFRIEFEDEVPAGSSVTFVTGVTANITGQNTFTINADPTTGVQGVISGLSLGIQPTLTQAGTKTSAGQITGLAINSNVITVTLSGNIPWSTGTMTVDLPPTGGFLPTTKVTAGQWSPTNQVANAIWARQTPGSGISVSGSRIYFSLVGERENPPQQAFTASSSGLTVTQFDPNDIWNKPSFPPTQYIELSANSLQNPFGANIFLDLSAVDGFFFPAELSATVGPQSSPQKIAIGQVANTYTSPTTTPPTPATIYSPVARQSILNAYDHFFKDSNPLFPTGSKLQAAYASLHKKVGSTSIGIQNPSFVDWSKSGASDPATVLNAAWNDHLDALFRTPSNQVDLLGDTVSPAWSYVNSVIPVDQMTGTGYQVGDQITFNSASAGGRPAKVQVLAAPNGNITAVTVIDGGIYPTGYKSFTIASQTGNGQGANLKVEALVSATAFYKGVPAPGSNLPSSTNPNKLVLTEYVGAPSPKPSTYSNLYATGAVFTVFDPRSVPASESQAAGLAVGEQILGNNGVFASTATNTSNYTPGGGGWSTGVALTQLTALQRDIVWALNQGNGGRGLGSGVPGSTAAYWGDEGNWYPYPHISGGVYLDATPQNLYSQWVHTAGSVGGPALDAGRYFATYPFGNVDSGFPVTTLAYGSPTKSWGKNGAGTGPLMNQTYGFAFDESPAHGFAGANVPSKFVPIPNEAGKTIEFGLVFGPWSSGTQGPSVQKLTKLLPATAQTLKIRGENFSPTLTGNTVKLTDHTGTKTFSANVQSATTSEIVLAFTSSGPIDGGRLLATVTTGGRSSGAVEVAQVYATAKPSTAPLSATHSQLVIQGHGFRAARNMAVTLSSGTAEVVATTATTMTLKFLTPPALGPLSITSLTAGIVKTPVADLPVVATVVPGPASAAKSTLATSASTAPVGTPVTVTLTARDANGNLVGKGGATVKFSTTDLSGLSPVMDNGNGTYTATFTTHRVGAQVFSATVNGAAVTTPKPQTRYSFYSPLKSALPDSNWTLANGGFKLGSFGGSPFLYGLSARRHNIALYTGGAASTVTVAATVAGIKAADPFGGVVARYSGTGNSSASYYRAGVRLVSGQYQAVIEKWTNGSMQSLGTTSITALQPPVSGGAPPMHVSFQLVGTVLRLTVNVRNGGSIIPYEVTYNDTANPFRSGSVGIAASPGVVIQGFKAS